MKDTFTNGMTWCLRRLGMGRYDPNWSKLQDGMCNRRADIDQEANGILIIWAQTTKETVTP